MDVTHTLRGSKALMVRSPRNLGNTALSNTALTLIFGLALPAVTHAAAPVAAQESQQQLLQQERQRELERRSQPKPDVHLQAPKIEGLEQLIPVDETPAFQIDKILLQGDAADKFQWALDGANYVGKQLDNPIGRRLGVKGITLVANRVQNAIIQRGFITSRVVVGEQNLGSGVLVLTIVPGRIGQVSLSPDSDGRANHRNAFPARPGDLLNLRDLEQALENFKRLPTASATFQIAPGGKDGESEVIITWQQKRPLRITASFDDGGSKQTGKYQGGTTIFWDNLFGLNDLIYLNLRRDCGGGDPGKRGNHGHSLHYSLPYGYWMVDFNHTRDSNHSSIPAGEAFISQQGSSSSEELKLSRLIYRDAQRKTTIGLKGFRRKADGASEIGGVTLNSLSKRIVSGWAVELNHRDAIGRATLDLTLGFQRGTGAFGAIRAIEESCEGDARFKILTVDATLKLPFQWGPRLYNYSATLRKQHSLTSLSPPQRFALGSRHTVRGFSGEKFPISADRGWLLRNELGTPMGRSGAELYLGLDYGLLSGPASRELATSWLAGTAIGMRGSWRRLSYDLFLAAPMRHKAGLKNSKLTGGFSINYNLFD